MARQLIFREARASAVRPKFSARVKGLTVKGLVAFCTVMLSLLLVVGVQAGPAEVAGSWTVSETEGSPELEIAHVVFIHSRQGMGFVRLVLKRPEAIRKMIAVPMWPEEYLVFEDLLKRLGSVRPIRVVLSQVVLSFEGVRYYDRYDTVVQAPGSRSVALATLMSKYLNSRSSKDSAESTMTDQALFEAVFKLPLSSPPAKTDVEVRNCRGLFVGP